MLSQSSQSAVKTPSLDPLSEVLQDLRLSGVSYGRCELARPWGIAFPAQKAARFHFVATGECWLRSAALGLIQLTAGDVVLLPTGADHTIADRVDSPTHPIDSFPMLEIGDRVYRTEAGGSGDKSILFCCSIMFDAPAMHPLLELMPEVLLVRGAATDDASLPMLLETIATEAMDQRIGASTVLTRLADAVTAKIIRAWAEKQDSDTTGWLAAIHDPKIGRALAAIHRHPGEPWSVDALADISATSRSRFHERFRSIVGITPGQYVTRWRMHLASTWLHDDRLTVTEVATRLGYESEASFSRSFKRFAGVPPSAMRHAKVTEASPIEYASQRSFTKTQNISDP